MALKHIAGQNKALDIIASKKIGTSNEVIVEVSGPYALVESQQPNYGDGHSQFSPCPDGYTVLDSTLTPHGRGGGRLTVRCVNYTNSQSSGEFSPAKTFFDIEMAATVYDLKQHPMITANAGAGKIIALWLNSSTKVQYSGSSGFSYTDTDGEEKAIESGTPAYKFCAAYTAGITTFTRYFPVITKKSIWKSLPGVTMIGNSQTGGSISQFSAAMGTWDAPPLSLNGYPSANWFKSADRYTQNQNQTYTRTEQWTYSPDGSSGPHGWIYQLSGGGQQ